VVFNTDSSGDLNADRRYEYAQALIAEKDFETALDLLKQTAELVPHWPPLWFTMGETYLQLKQSDLAVGAFEKVLSLDPSDRLGAGLRLEHLHGDKRDKTRSHSMSHAFVATLFDQYADRFDTHLTKALQYEGPAILFKALEDHCALAHRKFHFTQAADLGCGTGLMGEKLTKNVDRLFGVDLSEKMVSHALKSGFYDDVVCGDIVSTLAARQTSVLDLLIAADVLVYIGELEPLFTQAKRSLGSTGLFAFTVQSMLGAGYRLGPDMRYHHSADYIRHTAKAAGLGVETLVECVTRFDAGKPVPGFVVILTQGEED
jgi:predicted TPR repeat methyltransferase